MRRFTHRNLYRMRQFYEAYPEPALVSALLTQVSWTNHRLILSKTKILEEQQFYDIIPIPFTDHPQPPLSPIR
ncbi:MAG: DUF1016 family protein [Caldilinea sp. CFX5]|nr:DUF1016 family protein [Caldilinea sp. CFX5]